MSDNGYFENAVRDLYEAIARVKSVETISAQHKSNIQGRTSSHDVDLYWEFTDGDLTYKTVIQAQEKTTLGELFTFMRTIRDIPGQTVGVVLTQPVYQKDIKEMAANAGIILYEQIIPEQDLVEPVFSNIQVNVDKDWVKVEKERAGIGDEQVQVMSNPKYAFIYDDQGNCMDSVQGIFDNYGKYQDGLNQGEKKSIVHQFNTPVFLQTNHELVPFVKLNDIKFDLELVSVNELSGEEMVDYVLDKVFRYFGG